MEKKISAEDAALKKLQYGMKTESEMTAYLRENGYGREETGEAIESLRTMHYLNDEEYIRQFYRYARDKSWAEYRIIYELENKGIDKETCQNTIDDYKASDEYSGLKDDNAYALRVGVKMANAHLEEGHIMDDRFFGKVGRRLINLGYRERTIYYVIDRLRRGGMTNGAIESGESPEEYIAKIHEMQDKLEQEIRLEAEEAEKKAREQEAMVIQYINSQNS